MNEQSGDEKKPGWRQRLLQVRTTLLAAVIVLASLVVLDPQLLYAALLGLLVIAAAAVYSRTDRWPRGNADADRSFSADPADALTAKALADALDAPLILFNRKRDVVFANRAASVAFGELAPGTALPLKFRAPDMVGLIDRAVREGRASLPDYHERLPVERWYEVTAVSIGGTDLFLLVFADRGELRRVEKMRSDFIANASHELRTPLASVSGFIETLRGPAKNDPAAQEKFLSIMQDQTDRMARLIDDLLSLSRLEMKPHSRPETRVDLRAIVSGVVRSLQHMASEQGVTVEEHYPDGPFEVSGDRDELIQVFENLLSNACKYGRSGKRVEVAIDRRKSDGADAIAVSVRDFGPGIPREHIPRVTERFYRVDVETSRMQKGTGLGLSIVKHILTRHNGKLVVESEIGRGSTFTVILPESAGRH